MKTDDTGERLKSDIEYLRRRLKHFEDKSTLQEDLIEKLSGELRHILTSARWKALMKVVKTYDLVAGRQGGDTLHGHLERHLREYQSRLKRLPPLPDEELILGSGGYRGIGTRKSERSDTPIPVTPALPSKSSLGKKEKSLYEAALQREVLLPEDILSRLETHPQDDLISIITPTHNRAYSLRYCLESILAQTYKNFEVFVIDDASADETRRLVESYQEKDKRIHYILKPKSNVSETRNMGLRLARGKYIAFLDSDNVWDRRFLSTMYHLLGSSSGGEKVAYCDCHLYEKGTEKDGPSRPWSAAEYRSKPFIDLCTVFADHEAVRSAGFFNRRMTKWVDYELLLRLNNLSGDFLHVPYPLMSYFRLEDGLSLATAEQIPMRENMEQIWQAKLEGLKLAYVLNDFPALSQTFVIQEITYLLGQGIDVMVFHKIDPDRAAEIPTDLKVFRFDTVDQLESLLTKLRRNFIHTHFAYPMPVKFVLPVAERTGIPFTFMPHAVDLFLQLNAGRNQIDRVVSSPLCKAVFAIGSYHRQHFIERGCPPEKIVTARPFFDASIFTNPSPRPVATIRRIVSISRLQEKKGFHILIEAFKNLESEDLCLEIHGYGPQEEQLRTLANGDPRISFRPAPASATEVKAVLDQAELFVLPCVESPDRDKDGLPTVLREAMAAGVPVVSTSLSSIPDLIKDGENGWLAKPGDLESLVQVLKRILKLPQAQLWDIRKKAQKTIQRSFDVHATIEPLLEVWKKN